MLFLSFRIVEFSDWIFYLLFMCCLALDEGDIALLKSYVSSFLPHVT